MAGEFVQFGVNMAKNIRDTHRPKIKDSLRDGFKHEYWRKDLLVGVLELMAVGALAGAKHYFIDSGRVKLPKLPISQPSEKPANHLVIKEPTPTPNLHISGKIISKNIPGRKEHKTTLIISPIENPGDLNRFVFELYNSPFASWDKVRIIAKDKNGNTLSLNNAALGCDQPDGCSDGIEFGRINWSYLQTLQIVDLEITTTFPSLVEEKVRDFKPLSSLDDSNSNYLQEPSDEVYTIRDPSRNIDIPDVCFHRRADMTIESIYFVIPEGETMRGLIQGAFGPELKGMSITVEIMDEQGNVIYQKSGLSSSFIDNRVLRSGERMRITINGKNGSMNSGRSRASRLSRYGYPGQGKAQNRGVYRSTKPIIPNNRYSRKV